jgi:hypothetical protein
MGSLDPTVFRPAARTDGTGQSNRRRPARVIVADHLSRNTQLGRLELRSGDSLSRRSQKKIEEVLGYVEVVAGACRGTHRGKLGERERRILQQTRLHDVGLCDPKLVFGLVGGR